MLTIKRNVAVLLSFYNLPRILSITQFVVVALSPSQVQIDFPKRWSTTAFGTIYDTLKEQMVFNEGRSYAINITGGKKSMVASAGIFARDFSASILYVDYNDYDPNLRRPIPGSEYMNLVYTPTRDLPELFHQ